MNEFLPAEPVALHADCIACLARANGVSAEDQSLILIKTLEAVSIDQMRSDLCFEHVRRLGPTEVG